MQPCLPWTWYLNCGCHIDARELCSLKPRAATGGFMVMPKMILTALVASGHGNRNCIGKSPSAHRERGAA